MQRVNSISAGRCDLAWDGGDHPRRKRHEAMRRAMAGREIGGNDEWRDVASVPSPMPSAARFWSCDSGSYACSRTQPQTGSLFPWQAAGRSSPSSDGLDGRREPKRHETVWRAVASRKGSWNNRRRNLATIPESLPGAARLDDERSAAGRICARLPAPAPAPSPAPTQSGSLFPWQRPAAPPAGSAASTGGGSASAQEAQYRCPGSTVVWVNEHSHIYHFPGTRDYGHTKSGAYMCEAEAQTSGNRAAKNERHP